MNERKFMRKKIMAVCLTIVVIGIFCVAGRMLSHRETEKNNTDRKSHTMVAETSGKPITETSDSSIQPTATAEPSQSDTPKMEETIEPTASGTNLSAQTAKKTKPHTTKPIAERTKRNTPKLAASSAGRESQKKRPNKTKRIKRKWLPCKKSSKSRKLSGYPLVKIWMTVSSIVGKRENLST